MAWTGPLRCAVVLSGDFKALADPDWEVGFSSTVSISRFIKAFSDPEFEAAFSIASTSVEVSVTEEFADGGFEILATDPDCETGFSASFTIAVAEEFAVGGFEESAVFEVLTDPGWDFGFAAVAAVEDFAGGAFDGTAVGAFDGAFEALPLLEGFDILTFWF